LRYTDGIRYAFEGKVPVGNIFTTPVRYEVPVRYISQTLFEQQAMDAEKGTLYITWSKESSTVFVVPINTPSCPDATKRISQESKTLKDALQSMTDKSVYVGDFPSVYEYVFKDGCRYIPIMTDSEEGTSCTYSEKTHNTQLYILIIYMLVYTVFQPRQLGRSRASIAQDSDYVMAQHILLSTRLEFPLRHIYNASYLQTR
jgi:hypothetical protein